MKMLFLLLSTFPSVYAIPITIIKNSDLNFGSIIAGDPTRVIAPGTSENPQNASFTIQGDPNVSFNVILPSTATILINGTGPQQLVVNSITSNPSVAGTLNGAGTRSLYVGGSLNVPPATQRGDYSGTFTVEVVY